jgi:excisionase family DNA binding protein
MRNHKYLTTEEVCKLLKISIATLNRLIKRNEIPSYKVGHRRLFDRDELVEWVRARRVDD